MSPDFEQWMREDHSARVDVLWVLGTPRDPAAAAAAAAAPWVVVHGSWAAPQASVQAAPEAGNCSREKHGSHVGWAACLRC
eukprot:CAMPEP_0202423672 /NCGR_PEP_ID=MMETSP1128-20130828/51503_1 /ASSEMBLY_ACC=CAM_ASM_000463 /TAXON_ID=3047 /ORGANISM="Dunaliella tertiolecta, Strain CCMP1320" /LENGTH=80 /DNA_ID=CAMNT_0049031791 /DNA_START=728 /DNA_END=971 /DNA_ORIENTATION=+